MVKGDAPDILRLLREAGCTFVRHGKGDHEIWFSPLTNRNVIVDRGVQSTHKATAPFAI